ncbi:hypothetical protein BH23BAC1_BH23BAC1_40680 [soil metagenome]
MSIKFNHLIKLLIAHEYKTETIFKRIESKDIQKTGKENVANITYKELGGIQEHFPSFEVTRTVIGPQIILLFDEGLHFNRYRNLTLRSEIYNSIPAFPLENYRRYCRNYEKECAKAGLKTGAWSNTKSDFYFGASAIPGDFFKNGSGGWKLTAFKDFMEDIYWPFSGYRLLRIASYDHFMAEGKLVRIDSILERPSHPFQMHLIKFLDRRINSL